MNEKTATYCKGDRVHVSFQSNNFVVRDGNTYSEPGDMFEGDGVIDRAEDGYLFGQLDDGRCFGCREDSVQLIEDTAQEYCKSFDKAMMFIFLAFAAVVLKLSGV